MFAQYGKRTSYTLSAVGGEAFRSLLSLAIYDTDNKVNGIYSMELPNNQSALILEEDDHGEIVVHVASGDLEGLTATLCQAIATKLMGDEKFQQELMEMIEKE